MERRDRDLLPLFLGGSVLAVISIWLVMPSSARDWTCYVPQSCLPAHYPTVQHEAPSTWITVDCLGWAIRTGDVYKTQKVWTRIPLEPGSFRLAPAASATQRKLNCEPD